jgi:hypothetical protein
MKIIYRAANILEAHIVFGMLRARGIEAYVGGHYLQGAIGNLPPMDFAHVSVADDDFDAAMAVVREYEQGDSEVRENPADDDNPVGIRDF